MPHKRFGLFTSLFQSPHAVQLTPYFIPKAKGVQQPRHHPPFAYCDMLSWGLVEQHHVILHVPNVLSRRPSNTFIAAFARRRPAWACWNPIILLTISSAVTRPPRSQCMTALNQGLVPPLKSNQSDAECFRLQRSAPQLDPKNLNQLRAAEDTENHRTRMHCEGML